jgi:hypothetical protein
MFYNTSQDNTMGLACLPAKSSSLNALSKARSWHSIKIATVRGDQILGLVTLLVKPMYSAAR